MLTVLRVFLTSPDAAGRPPAPELLAEAAASKRRFFALELQAQLQVHGTSARDLDTRDFEGLFA